MAKKQTKTKNGSKKCYSRRNKIQKGGNQQLIDVIKDNTKTPEQLSNEVRELLLTDESIKLEYTTKQGRTPLHVASSLGYIDVVKALLEKGSYVNTQDKNGISPIHSAAYNGDADIIDALIAAPGISVNKTTYDGRTPLHFAANYDKLDAVKALLKYPAIDVNGEGPDMDSTSRIRLANHIEPPIHAALYHNNWDIVLALIEHPKIDLERKCAIDGTPLGIAAKKGNLDVVNALLEKGVKVDNLSTRKTPLYIASKKGHTDVVRVLLKWGANHNIYNSIQETPLYIASKEGHTDVVRVLLDAAQSTDYVNKPDNYGKTPLHIASQYGHTDVVAELICAGAQVNLVDWSYNTPLFYASYLGHINVVKKLLLHPDIRVSSGIEANGEERERRDGKTAVSHAAVNKHFDIVELLMHKLILERPDYGRIQAQNDRVEEQWQKAVERRGVAEVVVKGRSYSPHYVASETEIFVNEDEDKGKQLPLGLGCRRRDDGTLMQGEIGKFIGGKRKTKKRKTKKSKAKKDSKKRSSRRNKTQAGGAKTESDMLYDVTEKYDNNEDVNQTDKTGKTFLHRASEKGYLMVVNQLLEYPTVDVNKIREKTGKTALHYASKNGHWKVVKSLLTADKINVNIQDKLGKTPLHYASENGDWMVVQILCTANNINVNIRDELGKTPLHYAYHKGDPAVYGELIIAGADKDVVDITGKKPEYYGIIDNDALIKNILTPGDAINAPDTDNNALLHSYPRTWGQTHPYSKK